ncbi:hypothetical protein [Streptomyces goshikiensis]|uniref:hypothetical protein n=1 Tax=Streptomyces goshikiensis TaxID=1942 RepID=UPI003696775B
MSAASSKASKSVKSTRPAHAARPRGPGRRLVGHPPEVQRDGQPVAEQPLQLPVQQRAGRRVQQQNPRWCHGIPLPGRTAHDRL